MSSNRKKHPKERAVAKHKNPVPSLAKGNQKGWNNWYWIAVILALTFIVFIPALNNALTNWDDPRYLNDNPLIRKLSGANIKKIFTEPYFGNYQPLHIFSYAIEYYFYGLNPVGYHTTSVLMHLVVTFLVYRFIFLISGSQPIALLTALLFGIHPMHVESIAWAAERKDLLYSIFFMGSLILYVRYVKGGEKITLLIASVLLFLLSIFSKAMAASLPPTLILIDIFLKRKWRWKLAFEKIPFFVIALFFGLLSANIVASTGQVSLNVFTLPERIFFANLNLLTYLWKLIVPVELSAFYAYPQRVDGHLPLQCYIAPVIVLALAFLVIRSLRKTRTIFFGAGFFFVSIFLVLQLFPVGPTIISERYSYISSIGFLFVVAYFINEAIRLRPKMKTIISFAVAAYCIFLSATTYARCDIWKDSLTLWNNVLEQFPNAGIALNNRGNIYGKEKGDLDRAMIDFNRSIHYDPAYENAYANRGIVYCMRQQFDSALADFNHALQLKPDYFDARFNRGIAYSQTGEFQKAIDDFTLLLVESPDDSRVYMSRGRAYSLLKNYPLAMADLNRAIELNPSYPEAYYNRAAVNFNLKKYKEAYEDVQETMRLGMNVEKSFLETVTKSYEESK